jgi:hypothetical protein
MARFDITVWQFVRLMVRLEESAGRSPSRDALYAVWRDAWLEVDGRLERLGKNDAAAFSNLMMEQEVIVHCDDPDLIAQGAAALDEVIAAQAKTLQRANADLAESLRFERGELEALAKRFRAARRAAGKRRPKQT